MSTKELFNSIKTEFLNWYSETKQIPYYFTGKDAGNLKKLILKIQFIGQDKHKGEPNDWILNAFKWILNHLPDWIKKAPSIPLINSKFNEIIAYGRSKQPLSHLSPEYLSSVIQRSQGINPDLSGT